LGYQEEYDALIAGRMLEQRLQRRPLLHSRQHEIFFCPC
jgi:hypothetical protein